MNLHWSQPCGHEVIYNIKNTNLHRKAILKNQPRRETLLINIILIKYIPKIKNRIKHLDIFENHVIMKKLIATLIIKRLNILKICIYLDLIKINCEIYSPFKKTY